MQFLVTKRPHFFILFLPTEHLFEPILQQIFTYYIKNYKLWPLLSLKFAKMFFFIFKGYYYHLIMIIMTDPLVRILSHNQCETPFGLGGGAKPTTKWPQLWSRCLHIPITFKVEKTTNEAGQKLPFAMKLKKKKKQHVKLSVNKDLFIIFRQIFLHQYQQNSF